MRKFYTLLSREVSSYFYSPIAYIVLVFFLFVSGADFYFQISFMNQRTNRCRALKEFSASTLLILAPRVMQRLFAEEFSLGTMNRW